MSDKQIEVRERRPVDLTPEEVILLESVGWTAPLAARVGRPEELHLVETPEEINARSHA